MGEPLAVDRARFDDLIKLFATRGTRRAALAVLLGAAGLGATHDPAEGKGMPKRRRGHKKRRKQGSADQGDGDTASETCYPGTNCFPVRGGTHSGCDFSNSTVFVGLDAQGAVLDGTNFSGADATGADFRGAVLTGACFAGANLRDATIDTSTLLDDAIFCNTIMPNGSLNNAGCGREVACCPPVTGAPCDVCPSGCRFISVKAAIDAAPDGSNIVVCPGTYDNDFFRPLVIDKNLRLIGAGAESTIVRRDEQTFAADPFVIVRAGRDVAIWNLTLNAGIQGPVIQNEGTLALRGVVVTGAGLGGSGIVNRGVLTLQTGTQVRNNDGRKVGQRTLGGGIYNEGTLTLESGSVIGGRLQERNVAKDAGGGIYNAAGTATLKSGSRVSGNNAGPPPTGSGGGVFVAGGTVFVEAKDIVVNNYDITIQNISNCGGNPVTPAGNCIG
jgi:hypothetical protein